MHIRRDEERGIGKIEKSRSERLVAMQRTIIKRIFHYDAMKIYIIYLHTLCKIMFVNNVNLILARDALTLIFCLNKFTINCKNK